MGIVQLGERQRFRLFVRHDPFERFVSCLIFVPRENYTTELRRKFQCILLEAFNGSAAEFDVLLTDEVLARIHLRCARRPDGFRHTTDARSKRSWRRPRGAGRTTCATRSIERDGEAARHRALQALDRAFPAAYRERIAARAQWTTSRNLDALVAQRRSCCACTGPLGAPAARSASRSTASARRWRCRTACRCWSTWACACSPSGRYRDRRRTAPRRVAARLRA